MGLDEASLGTPMALIAALAALGVAHQRQLAQVAISAHGWRDVRLGDLLDVGHGVPLADPPPTGRRFPPVCSPIFYSPLFDGFLRTGAVQMPEWFSAFLKSIDKEVMTLLAVGVATFLTTCVMASGDTSAVSRRALPQHRRLRRSAVCTPSCRSSSNTSRRCRSLRSFICATSTKSSIEWRTQVTRIEIVPAR